jgi:hypothetical protein
MDFGGGAPRRPPRAAFAVLGCQAPTSTKPAPILPSRTPNNFPPTLTIEIETKTKAPAKAGAFHLNPRGGKSNHKPFVSKTLRLQVREWGYPSSVLAVAQKRHTTKGAIHEPDVGCSLSVTRHMMATETANAAPKENLPNGPRSGSCLGIFSDDHRPCPSRHALRQGGKRRSLTTSRASCRQGSIVAVLPRAAPSSASQAWPSTSALSSSTGYPSPVRLLPKAHTEAPNAPTHSQLPSRVSLNKQPSPHKKAASLRKRPSFLQDEKPEMNAKS